MHAVTGIDYMKQLYHFQVPEHESTYICRTNSTKRKDSTIEMSAMVPEMVLRQPECKCNESGAQTTIPCSLK